MQVIVSQYSQSEYNLRFYKVTFLPESSVKIVYNLEPALGWTIDQSIKDQVRGVV